MMEGEKMAWYGIVIIGVVSIRLYFYSLSMYDLHYWCTPQIHTLSFLVFRITLIVIHEVFQRERRQPPVV